VPSAVGHDETGETSDEPDSAKPTWRPLTVLLAVAIVALLVGATYLVAGGDAFEIWDSTPDTCAVEAQASSVGTIAPPVASQTLSTEPILQWRRVEPPVDDPSAYAYSDLHSTDDGRVAVIVDEDGGHRLELTADGVEWEAHPLPQGVDPRHVHISSDRWIIVERALDDSGTGAGSFAFPRVLLSNDRGATWTEVPLDPGTPLFFEDGYMGTIGLHVAADRVLLVSYIWPYPQFAELIADRGFIDSTNDIEHLGLGTHSTTMWMRADESGEDAPVIEISHDELGLSPRQELLLNRWVAAVTSGPDGYVRTYSGDANGLSVTGDFDVDADLVSSVGTRDGFVLSLGERQGESRLFASADGREWSEVEVDPPIRTHLAGARGGDTVWAVIFGDESSTSFASFRCGQAPRTAAVLEGLAILRPHDPGLAVGASGLSVTVPIRSERSTYPDRLGWSADGIVWDWQTAVDAFGFEPNRIRIAVGDGFVLANVYGRFTEDHGWFVAEVP